MQRVAFRFATLGKACGESDKAGHDPAAPHARTSTVLNASLSAADLPGDWRDALADEFAQPYMAALDSWLAAEHAAGRRLFPARDAWFHAFAATPLADVRVVILGQDPYHGEGQAHGLAFSVRPGVRPPPSLINIYKELGSDLGLARPDHGHLERWARQGVLLLNTALTVEAGRAAAHRGRGWERFTDAVIAAVAARAEPVVFLLWGAHAQGKAALVRAAAPDGRHLVLTAPHPSPLSARTGFFGCRHFSKANAFLEARGRGTVDWSLDREAGVERA